MEVNKMEKDNVIHISDFNYEKAKNKIFDAFLHAENALDFFMKIKDIPNGYLSLLIQELVELLVVNVIDTEKENAFHAFIYTYECLKARRKLDLSEMHELIINTEKELVVTYLWSLMLELLDLGISFKE